jgi:DNA invertase Pin-like site-specific DNA recombinase
MIRDRDRIYGAVVTSRLRAMGIRDKPTAPASPWQNGAFAEFERSVIRQRVKLGLKRAVAQGRQLGRPRIDSKTERKTQRELRKGTGILRVAQKLNLGTGTVHRIKREMEAVS